MRVVDEFMAEIAASQDSPASPLPEMKTTVGDPSPEISAASL
jgi:hypothetical protein